MDTNKTNLSDIMGNLPTSATSVKSRATIQAFGRDLISGSVIQLASVDPANLETVKAISAVLQGETPAAASFKGKGAQRRELGTVLGEWIRDHGNSDPKELPAALEAFRGLVPVMD